MKEAGIGNLVFLEVDVGVPRGPVKFMSAGWQELFAHAVHEAERLGIDITLGVGPGWTGSGGPWVKAEQSMQHLVFSTTEVKGPQKFDGVLDVPEQRSTKWHKMRDPYYKDFAVYAFGACKPVVSDINEKALYERDPYTSKRGVKPYLPAAAQYREPEEEEIISIKNMLDLTEHTDCNGRLQWDVPEGRWTILRMGSRSTGAATRPAPEPGVGLECDKFDPAAFDDHFENFIGKLLKKVGRRSKNHGWTTLHMDSWEMGAQNWTDSFCKEFQARRGYDPKPYLPAYSGRVVESMERTERFLWDVRLTAQELVVDYHALRIKELGRKHGFELSIEPYDMNPTAD
ncbi:MAG: glycosyl hydrolase, partial [Planctomycetota bacterium]